MPKTVCREGYVGIDDVQWRAGVKLGQFQENRSASWDIQRGNDSYTVQSRRDHFWGLVCRIETDRLIRFKLSFVCTAWGVLISLQERIMGTSGDYILLQRKIRAR